MKKFLLSLFVALIGATMWNTTSARIIQSSRVAWNEIKAGDTIALEVGTPGSNQDYFLGVTTEGNLQNVTPFSSRTAWIISEGPKDVKGQQTYYLQNLSTGKFLGSSNTSPMQNGMGSVGMYEDIEYALPFSIHSAADSSEVASNYGPIWDENSAVFCFLRDNLKQNFMCAVGYWGIGTVYWWGEYHDTNAWNAYRVLYEHDMQGDLQALIDEISESGIEYEAGTKPGEYTQEAVDEFNSALEDALICAMEEHTDAEYEAAMNRLKDAKAAVEASYNPITEGYYYVVSAYDAFINKQSVEKAWTSNGSKNIVGWTTYDAKDPAQMFLITPLASGNFTIQNYENGKYVNGSESNAGSQKVLFAANPGNEQKITSIGAQQWLFSNTFCNISYHPESHSSGSGSSGDLVTYNDNKLNDKSTWYLRQVPDSIVDNMAEIKAQKERNATLSDLVVEATGIWDNLRVYMVDTTGLITNADDNDEGNQLSSNAKDPQQGNYACLINGATGSGSSDIFHSTWHVANDPLTSPHNLQVNISENPSTGFVLKMCQRTDSWGDKDRPCIVNIYASDDPEAEDAWTFIRQVDFTNSWGSASDHVNWVASPTVDLGREYSYVRMDVMTTSGNRKNNGATYPFFSLSELQLYPVVLNQSESQYCYTEGLAPVADAMFAQATAASEKVAAGTASEEDITALREAIAAVKSLYADTTDLAILVNKVEDLVNNPVIGEGIGETSQEAVDALASALETAKGASFSTPLKKSEIDEALNALQSAVDTYLATIKMPEVGKWYHIISASACENHFNDGDESDLLPVNNSALYADGPGKGDHIRYGLLTEEGEPNYTYNPKAMWRLVEMEGVEGQYAIQCMATGQYIGDGSKLNGSIYSSYTPVPYTIELLGKASFALVPDACTVEGNGMALYNCDDGQHAVVNTKAVDGDAAFKFVEIDPEETEMIVINTFSNNLMDVIAVPYNLTGIAEINEGVHLYAVKKMTQEENESGALVTTVELYEVDELAAGESGIIVLGEPGEEREDFELVIPFPTEVVNKATPVNGVLGTLVGESIPAGAAFSDCVNFIASPEGTGVTPYTGGIDAAQYTGEVEGVETALVLTIEGLNPLPSTGKKGDVNGDGSVNGADVVAIYNYIQAGESSNIARTAADVDGDGSVNGADVVATYNIIVGGAAGSPRFQAQAKRFLNK